MRQGRKSSQKGGEGERRDGRETEKPKREGDETKEREGEYCIITDLETIRSTSNKATVIYINFRTFYTC